MSVWSLLHSTQYKSPNPKSLLSPHKSQNARIPFAVLLLTPKYLSLFAPRPPSPYNFSTASAQLDSAIPVLTPLTRFAHKFWNGS
ncbi:hypothetical protein VNO80_08673 [Phaseolus coccineus]|uniref:Uncharacterized protein n=1 Tax=Phaseolus coccineus TaxID=3886 RepID=A0AAN9RBY0_PHACN